MNPQLTPKWTLPNVGQRKPFQAPLEKNVAGTTGKNTCYFIGSLLAEGLYGTRPIVPRLRGGAVPEQMPGQASQAFAAGPPIVGHALAAIKAPIFLSGPIPLIAPCPKIGLGSL